MSMTNDLGAASRPFNSPLLGFSDQNADGVDLYHLRANLRLTPTERLERNRRSHELLMEVRRAGAVARLRRDSRRS